MIDRVVACVELVDGLREDEADERERPLQRAEVVALDRGAQLTPPAEVELPELQQVVLPVRVAHARPEGHAAALEGRVDPHGELNCARRDRHAAQDLAAVNAVDDGFERAVGEVLAPPEQLHHLARDPQHGHRGAGAVGRGDGPVEAHHGGDVLDALDRGDLRLELDRVGGDEGDVRGARAQLHTGDEAGAVPVRALRGAGVAGREHAHGHRHHQEQGKLRVRSRPPHQLPEPHRHRHARHPPRDLHDQAQHDRVEAGKHGRGRRDDERRRREQQRIARNATRCGGRVDGLALVQLPQGEQRESDQHHIEVVPLDQARGRPRQRPALALRPPPRDHEGRRRERDDRQRRPQRRQRGRRAARRRRAAARHRRCR